VLYQNILASEGKLLVMPRSMREEAIRLHHDIPSAGHQGVKRT